MLAFKPFNTNYISFYTSRITTCTVIPQPGLQNPKWYCQGLFAHWLLRAHSIVQVSTPSSSLCYTAPKSLCFSHSIFLQYSAFSTASLTSSQHPVYVQLVWCEVYGCETSKNNCKAFLLPLCSCMRSPEAQFLFALCMICLLAAKLQTDMEELF